MTSDASPPGGVDPRLILADEELDRALESFFLAETALWAVADRALSTLGRGHYRAAFMLKRRPGAGVQDLARLLGLSKQGASRVLRELVDAGLASVEPGAFDGRRRPARLTDQGEAFEAGVTAALRAMIAAAYRQGGLDAAPGARRILAALAGPLAQHRRREEP